MKTEINALLIAAVLFAGGSGVAMAASDAQTSPLSETAMPAASAKLTAGEVRKVDTEQGKLTIKHEAIENCSGQVISDTSIGGVRCRFMLESIGGQVPRFGVQPHRVEEVEEVDDVVSHGMDGFAVDWRRRVARPAPSSG